MLCTRQPSQIFTGGFARWIDCQRPLEVVLRVGVIASEIGSDPKQNHYLGTVGSQTRSGLEQLRSLLLSSPHHLLPPLQ